MKYLIICLYRALWIWPRKSFKLLFVKNYNDLYNVAVWEIKQLSIFGSVSMISAPLFSGGSGTFENNLQILKRYYRFLSQGNKVIWNQIPYLDLKIKRWAKNLTINTSEKIQKFYIPIIKSSHITELICASGNHSSEYNYLESAGCKAERKAAKEQGITITNYFNETLHI